MNVNGTHFKLNNVSLIKMINENEIHRKYNQENKRSINQEL